MPDPIESMRLELRRGVLALAVLMSLKQEHYGYSLRKLLLETGLDIEEGTLYPLVRRLESNGLLESRWSEGDGRKRRYYRISKVGETTLAALQDEWETLNRSVTRIKEAQQ
ncbi:MAG: PadR family transcriptional regulator [Pseudohongiellaceae bacterium]